MMYKGVHLLLLSLLIFEFENHHTFYEHSYAKSRESVDDVDTGMFVVRIFPGIKNIQMDSMGRVWWKVRRYDIFLYFVELRIVIWSCYFYFIQTQNVTVEEFFIQTT